MPLTTVLISRQSISVGLLLRPKKNIDSSYYKTDTIPGFRNEYDYNMSTALSTHIYGMYTFNKWGIVAIRHVLIPTISFVYTPDFGSQQYGYYRYFKSGQYPKPIPYYSIFDGGVYKRPNTGRNQ